MKKIAIFVAAFVLTLGLAQCKKEQPATPQNTEGNLVHLTVNVGASTEAQQPTAQELMLTPQLVFSLSVMATYSMSATTVPVLARWNITPPRTNSAATSVFRRTATNRCISTTWEEMLPMLVKRSNTSLTSTNNNSIPIP